MNKFFSVAVENCNLTERDIFDCIRGVTGQRIIAQECDYTGWVKKKSGKKDNPAIAEMMQMAKVAPENQQPVVPIQFVYFVDKGELYNAEYLKAGLHNECTVEQIGAVLYVKGKE
jgi:hypothetical protein